MLAYNVGEQCEFVLFFNAGILPVIGQFIPGFLPCHALLNPLFATSQFLPVFSGSVQTLGK